MHCCVFSRMARERTNNKLSPHLMSTSGFEPRPNWGEMNALTTVQAVSHLHHTHHKPQCKEKALSYLVVWIKGCM